MDKTSSEKGIDHYNLYEKAKSEFKYLKQNQKDAIVLDFEKEILALVKKFSESGQSSSSAPHYINAITNVTKLLLNHEPISPLTGDENEWHFYDANVTVNGFPPECYQNKRLSSVFRDEYNKLPYYLDAIIFKDEEEFGTFTGSVYKDDSLTERVYSYQYIKKFPFTPKTFYIDVKYAEITEEEAVKRDISYFQDSEGKCYYTVIKDKEQLKEVFEYYIENVR